MDLLDDDLPAPGGNLPEFSVSELSGAIKRTLEGEFGRVRVRGEVGRVMRARSGHLYYDIKDDRNTISCNTWKGQVPGLGVDPEEGMEVIVTGRISAYGPQSRYNMNVDSMEVAGAGALMAMLEKRKKQLAAEGLFAEDRKRPLPYLPGVVGVITSPSGAVIRDILHRLRDRFPRHVLVWPVAVQGKPCAPEVANAIRGFNALDPTGPIPVPDVLIVARGGGSMEDLWGFNEEIVARAAADSRIPLISAVGHETDTTLIDFVSDRRAPTPTAAAEMAVPVRLDLLAATDDFGRRLDQGLRSALSRRKQRLTDVGRGLPRPEGLIAPARQRFDLNGERLEAALRRSVDQKRLRLDRAAAKLTPAGLRSQSGRQADRLADLTRRLQEAPLRRISQAKERLALRSERITPTLLDRPRREGAQRLERALSRLTTKAQSRVDHLRVRLDAIDRMRLSLGYEETLKRGYAVVWDGKSLVTDVKSAKDASALEIQFADGRHKLTASPKRGKSPAPDKDQGSLF